ncbi:MAG: hypothetical protein WCT31_03715 [Candidatus Micrarchaeia archaeon]
MVNVETLTNGEKMKSEKTEKIVVCVDSELKGRLEENAKNAGALGLSEFLRRILTERFPREVES